MMRDIIQHGIHGEYVSSVKPHDMIGMPEYCHFTSPIRRLSDCICHYLLKYIYYKNKNYSFKQPFDEDELSLLSSKCLAASKKDKKIQFMDKKFRMIQAIDKFIRENESTTIHYHYNGYTGLFINLTICGINEMNIYMSYVIRIRNFDKKFNINQIYSAPITRVNCYMRFDENTIPELEQHVLS